MTNTITFIGLGKMGSAMAEMLLNSGHKLTVYNRTAAKAEPFAKLGATVANSLEEAVTDADIVFSSLIDDAALISVCDTMLQHMKPGAIHISTSTILPKTAEQLEQRHKELGFNYLATPVLGVPKALRSQTATAICAGEHTAFEKIAPLLDSYSEKTIYLGETANHANVFKICMNTTLLSALELISELYAFAEKSGLDPEIINGALKQIYAHPAVHLYIDKIHQRDFDDVNFDMKGGHKDVKLFQEAFNQVGVSPDIAKMLQTKFTQALDEGMHDKDWSAIGGIIRQQAGLD
jgi:3-hydroxyisobutyrate dehydrogenase-like beta-hydroxyacid dehydrogenase